MLEKTMLILRLTKQLRSCLMMTCVSAMSTTWSQPTLTSRPLPQLKRMPWLTLLLTSTRTVTMMNNPSSFDSECAFPRVDEHSKSSLASKAGWTLYLQMQRKSILPMWSSKRELQFPSLFPTLSRTRCAPYQTVVITMLMSNSRWLPKM